MHDAFRSLYPDNLLCRSIAALRVLVGAYDGSCKSMYCVCRAHCDPARNAHGLYRPHCVGFVPAGRRYIRTPSFTQPRRGPWEILVMQADKTLRTTHMPPHCSIASTTQPLLSMQDRLAHIAWQQPTIPLACPLASPSAMQFVHDSRTAEYIRQQPYDRRTRAHSAKRAGIGWLWKRAWLDHWQDHYRARVSASVRQHDVRTAWPASSRTRQA